MDLERALLELLAPLAPNDALVHGVRLAGATAETGPRLLFDADEETIAVEVSPRDASRPAAATSRRLGFAYVASGEVARARGLEICRAVAARAERNEERVLAALAVESAAANAAPRIRDVRVERILEPARDGARRFHTLSPYVGCLVGCRFCYAQTHVAHSRRFAGLPEVAWGSYVDVRVNAAEALARELDADDVAIVKMCPIVSDPYHAIEEKRGVTRACIDAIARAARRPALVVLTRSALIARDGEALGAAGAFAGFSLPTLDDDARAHFEPRAAPVAARLAALRALRAAGCTTFAVVQPILPGSIEALADAVAETCTSARVDVLHGVEGAAREFADARFSVAANEAWQSERAAELVLRLRARGVAIWRGELPPELSA